VSRRTRAEPGGDAAEGQFQHVATLEHDPTGSHASFAAISRCGFSLYNAFLVNGR
jgi:hypothetical protein